MLIALGAWAAPRDHDYGRYGPGYSATIVDRTLQDLRRAASNARLDGHERKHFHGAMKELEEFQDRWRRGRFETKHLDKAIDNLRHLANADRLHPRDRAILANDMGALRNFRASGGHGRPYTRGRTGWHR